jgi:outer membrane receptor for ferrienterochelin and colicins
MKKYILLFICQLWVWPLLANSTDINIFGHVVQKKTGGHLPHILISLKGTTFATTTDATGHYFLKNLPEGEFTIEVRFVGYQPLQQKIKLAKQTSTELNFELEESNISLNEVVVSANRNETSRRLTPTLVSILDVSTFDRTNSCTIAEGLNFQPGLRVENNCQNCGFTQVRMNGLGGAYSQILIDSRPVFSALAGVYGLEQIPVTMLERIEVVRGGGSALFGASAIAGTINVITKEPVRNSAELSHSLMVIGGKGNFDNNTGFNASLVSDDHKMGALIFGQRRHKDAFDSDGDGFSELPQLNSNSLGFRSFIKTGVYSKITFEYHHINEFRRGGDRLKEQPFDAWIAEQVQSSIDGGSLKYDIFSPGSKHRFALYGASQLVNRKSYYGAGEPVSEIWVDPSLSDSEKLEKVQARMNSFGVTKDVVYSLGTQYSYDFDRFFFMPSAFTAGIEYTSDKLTDRSGYRQVAIDQTAGTKSLFAQNEWKNERWSFFLGGRLDKHGLLDHAVFSPRANVRYNPTPEVNIRLSYGQGFRAPQLFDEDLHVDLASGALIVRRISPGLKEERSNSFSGSMDWCHEIGAVDLDFLAEGFFTYLRDPFTTISEDQPDGTVIKTVENGSGAKVYGVNLETKISYRSLLLLQVGATLQRSLYCEPTKWSGNENDQVIALKRMMRTPDLYGFFVATWTPTKRLSSNLSGKYTGDMLVPYEGGGLLNKTVTTPVFFELGWKLAYQIPLYNGSVCEINGGIQNIFNSYQKDFDKGPNRVSTYVFGPGLPRSIFLGAKLSF